jgi:glycosyltransferase involved in cell wall biosynthesis
MIKRSLRELYGQHQGKVSDKWSIYLAEYDRIFSSFRDGPVRFLEIGIQNGGSLDIWSEFFPRASKIIGCDINPDCAKLVYADSRISVVVGDANTDDVEARISAISPEFDLIVDDGSHTSGDIVRSFARYFPRLADGGLFVAEDLHCSYWSAYEGGLFHPASSISFFKRLADIISHEHWGVPVRRKDVLVSFMRKYDFDIDENLLSHIHSIEFANSLCIIRKAQPVQNELGTRFIAGTDDSIVAGLQVLRDKPQGRPDETGNSWAMRAQLPEDELEAKTARITSLESQLAKEVSKLASLRSTLLESSLKAEKAGAQLRTAERELNWLNRQHEVVVAFADSNGLKLRDMPAALSAYQQQIREMRASRSWRMTAPIRWGGRQARRILRTLKIIPPAIRQAGGFTSTFKRAVGILRNSGFNGLRSSARVFEAQLAGPAPAEEAVATSAVPNAYKNTYKDWLKLYDPDPMDDQTRAEMRRRIGSMAETPLISIVMPCYNTNPVWLRDAIESVRRQIYPHWELCIADDASPSVETREVLTEYTTSDSRVKVVFRPQNGHIVEASNSALKLVSGKWIALMDHDDLISEHALFWIADCINRNPDAQLIYSDEDKIDENGVRSAPYFKSDWNIDLFYSQNMFSHLGVLRTDLVTSVGGFRSGMQGSQDWDLVLRCVERVQSSQVLHVPRVLYHWRIHADSTAHSPDAKPYAAIAGEKAINDHLEREGLNGRAEYIGTGYRVRYALPANLPLVSLIIPTRNGLELLRQCVDSILARTSYDNYEITIVDNGSDDRGTLDYFESFRDSDLVRVIRDDREFNYSALNNMAVTHAKGELVGLINNDIEVISPEWLSEMVSLAIQPGVGAVGAKLWYPDRTIQHGGVVLGVGGVASHAHKGSPEGDNGYFGRAHLIQSFSAVTAACLVIKKDRYLAVNGLDEENLKVAFNDVDFCLRLREAGYRNIWTPYAELFHHESATRGADSTPEKQERFTREVNFMLARWESLIKADPAYSPNLTLAADDFSYAWPPRVEVLSTAHLQ